MSPSWIIRKGEESMTGLLKKLKSSPVLPPRLKVSATALFRTSLTPASPDLLQMDQRALALAVEPVLEGGEKDQIVFRAGRTTNVISFNVHGRKGFMARTPA